MSENKLRKITREFSINLKKFDTIGNREFNSAEEIFVQAEKQIKDLMLSEEEIEKIIESFLIEGEGIDSGEIAKSIIQARRIVDGRMIDENEKGE